MKTKIKSSQISTHFSNRFCFAHRLISLILLFSISATSMFAAPESSRTLLVSVGEVGQDLSLRFQRENFGAALGTWAKSILLFLKATQTARLSRIEIKPGGEVTIRQGEPINLTAIGYDTTNLPVGGLKFEWTVADAASDLPPYVLADGTFSARTPGNFVITASAEGLQSQVKIDVEENQPLTTLQAILDDVANGRTDRIRALTPQEHYASGVISSKRDYLQQVQSQDVSQLSASWIRPGKKGHGPSPESDDLEPTAPASTKGRMLRRPADEDGWSNNNWWMADDPGNNTGNPPGTSPDAGAGNGNFQFSAPVVSLPGRGIDINLSLNYNSRVWSKAGTTMSFDAERGYPAPGWNLGFGKMMFMGTSGGCMLIDADGTNHGYTGTISNYDNGAGTSSTNFYGHTTDGTFIDYSCYISTSSGVTTMSGSSSLPNGTQVSYFTYSANGKQAFPTQILDAQGNYINITYRNSRGPEIQTVTDTLGRVITFNYDSSTPARLISVDVPKMDNSGTRTAVRLHYKTLALTPGWAGGLTSDTNNATPYVVDAIYYPGTSTGYWFGADPLAADYNTYYSSYGMIAKVVEQRGMGWSGTAGDQGTITAGTMSKQAVYNYTLTQDYSLTDAPTYTTLTESWAGIDTDPAVTQYDLHMNATPRTVTVTQPNGIKSKQTMYNTAGVWTDGLIYQDETLDGSNTQLAKSVVTWEQGAYDSPRPAQTQATDEKLQTTKTTYTYGSSYNQVTSQKEYDYDGLTLLKETRNSYENATAYTSRHIFSLVTTTEVYDGNNNRQSKTDYTYDGATLVADPNVTMFSVHNDPYTTAVENTGVCLHWYQPPYGSQVCTQWQIGSAYHSSTAYRGNVTQITAYTDAAPTTPNGPISQTKQYDIAGNVRAESASCCELKTYDYTVDTQYAYPTTQTRGSSDPNSTIRISKSNVYDFNTGIVKASTDANGRTDSTTYNLDTLRPISVTSPTGAYSVTSYDDAAMTVISEVHEYGGALADKTVKYLNGVGLVSKEESYGPNNVVDVVESKYNQRGEVWKQSRPYRSGDTVQWSEKFYDLQGRVTKVIEPDGSETKAFYNETQRPDSASNYPGSTVRVMDAWGRDRWGRYDALGRLVEVVEPKPDGDGLVFTAGSLVTNYSYDTLGRLTGTNQGGQVRSFKYDSLGRITRQKLAEQTATINDAGTYVGSGGTGALWSSALLYDDRSNVTQKTDARGVQIKYSYQLSGGGDDPLNRIQSISYDLSGAHDTSKPIPTAPTVTYEYMTTGDQDRLKKETTAGVSTDELAYDTEGRVTDETKTFLTRSAYPMVTSYTYDTLNRTATMRLPAQYGLSGDPRKFVQHFYDTSNRLTTLKYGTALGYTQQAGGIVYNAADQATSIDIGPSGANQVTEQYTFDPQTGLLTNQKAVNSSKTLLDLSYDYNRNNSIGTLSGKTGHLTKILNNLDHNRDREYKFDAIGRLTSAKGGVNSALWSQTYGYDRWGNRTSVAATGVAADNTTMPPDGIPSLTFNTANNQVTTSNQNGQFEYDVAGNQTRALSQDGTTWIRYEYDAANRLVNIRQDNGTTLIESQQFGVGNERIALTDAVINQTTWYADSVEYTENNGNGTLAWSKTCTYLGDSLLSTITSDGAGGETTEYNHSDKLGTLVVTNQQSGTSFEQAHLPFGRSLDAESTGSTTKRFTSYERSARTDLDFAVNRTYDSKQGRFTQVDPIGLKASNFELPQTLNLYTYCGNDPINHIDPDGLFWGAIGRFFKAVGKALSAVGRAIATVLSNKWVSLIITVLSIVVPVFSILKTLQIIKAIPTLITYASKALSAISTIGLIGKTAEITGELFQGHFLNYLKIVLVGLASSVVGVIEDSIVNGSLDAIKSGHFSFKGVLKGAWTGFKKGLGYVKTILSRKGSWYEKFIPIYGFFCGPGWGIPGGATANETPTDNLDTACYRHDNESVLAKDPSINPTASDRRRALDNADWNLIKRSLIASSRTRLIDLALGTRYTSGDVYRSLVPFAFGERIVQRNVIH